MSQNTIEVINVSAFKLSVHEVKGMRLRGAHPLSSHISGVGQMIMLHRNKVGFRIYLDEFVQILVINVFLWQWILYFSV